VQVAVELLFHVEPVGFADADDDAGDFGEIAEELVEQLLEKLVHGPLAFHGFAQGGRPGHHIHGEIDIDARVAATGEERTKIRAVCGDLGADAGLIGNVIGQVGHVVEAHGGEAGVGVAFHEAAQVFADLGKQRLALLRREFLEAPPGNLRPVDADAVVAAEERADGIDEVERLTRAGGCRGGHPYWKATDPLKWWPYPLRVG